jgi:hypothetical protein
MCDAFICSDSSVELCDMDKEILARLGQFSSSQLDSSTTTNNDSHLANSTSIDKDLSSSKDGDKQSSGSHSKQHSQLDNNNNNATVRDNNIASIATTSAVASSGISSSDKKAGSNSSSFCGKEKQLRDSPKFFSRSGGSFIYSPMASMCSSSSWFRIQLLQTLVQCTS